MPIARHALALARAEFKAFWSSANGGLALAVFLILGGLWFYNSVVSYSFANLEALARGRVLDANLALFSASLSRLGLIVMLVTPLSTMRAFASFERGGHLDLLLAWPLTRAEIVLGHFGASLGSLALLLLLSALPFALALAMGVGTLKLLAVAFLGLILLGSAFTAVGLAVASRTRAPFAAALATLGILSVLWGAGWAAPYLADLAAALVQGLSFGPRVERFSLGLINFNDVFYFLCLTAMGLGLAQPFEE
ncbi:MAG: hypothetical protein LBO66_06785 [Deltaproteobacteria bacterium]|jgi:ABC-2 type transport system permease protein|nr:hypothetical protein [Deltaproteobacteria bacterium]